MTEYWVATAFLSALANTKTQNPNRGRKGGSLKDRADIRKASLSYFNIYIYKGPFPPSYLYPKGVHDLCQLFFFFYVKF